MKHLKLFENKENMVYIFCLDFPYNDADNDYKAFAIMEDLEKYILNYVNNDHFKL